MTVLVTGGAGFIGSNFILNWLEDRDESIVNLDKITYAGNLQNFVSLKEDARYRFFQGDIGDCSFVDHILKEYQPRAIINLAAESHVDRSIHSPADFIMTNIVGTFSLLESTRSYWSSLPTTQKKGFRFLHISTDEVYGSLSESAPPFKEINRIEPNSPYSASKASSDHLVRAYHQTYGLPTLTTNCSNNYGPMQFPEKLIPLIICNAVSGKALPIYGDGMQIRDWLYVKDHYSAICRVLDAGRLSETYNVGGWNEKSNIEVVRAICDLLDELSPKADGSSYMTQIEFVNDRPGHDRRYAVDAGKIEKELNWKPVETFNTGIRKTVQWYLDNIDWVQRVQSGAYRDWANRHYGFKDGNQSHETNS